MLRWHRECSENLRRSSKCNHGRRQRQHNKTHTMVSTKNFIGHLVPMVIFVTLGSLNSSSASKQCKSTVMNVVMRQCSDAGVRAKREVRSLEVRVQEIDADAAEIIGIPEYPRVKRQLDLDAAMASDAVPIVPDMRTSSLTGRRHLLPISGRYAPTRYADPVRIVPPYAGVPQHYVEAGPPPAPTQYQSEPSYVREFLPHASGDSLGFELSMDETDELYNEIADRITRHSPMSPDEVKRLFLETAAKCCQNEELCIKEQKLGIHCV